MEYVNERRQILFPSLKLSALLKNTTPGKFAYICHFAANWNKRDNVWKTGIYFKSDIFTAVAVVDAKAPYWLDEQ